MNPGLHHGLSNAEYHADPALGSSGLRKLARSPLHYAASIDPQRKISEPSFAMRAGTLAHCALLEPAMLGERYTVRPDGLDLRTKDGKAWAASIDVGSEIISAEQLLTAQRQADAIRALPEVGALLSNGEPEVSAFWVDEATGASCKCRPDWVSPAGEGVVLLDLKTTQDASPGSQGFARSIVNYGYHLQAAWYSDGYEHASRLQVLGFVFACVESEWPHAAAAYMVDDAGLDKARAQNRRLLELYAACRQSNEWPGYASTIQPISLPAWALAS